MLRSGLHGQNSRTISAHKPRDIRTDDRTVQKFFHAAQHGIIVKRTALHHNMIAQIAHILQLHDLEQCIFDHRKRNAC